MRKGNRQALAELYERREPSVYRYALHMSGSRSVAEEVTNDVFLRLIGPDVRFDPRRGSLEAYLIGAARNLVRVARRNCSVEKTREQASAHDILGDLIKSEMTAALYAALRQLPDGYRDAVVLCDLEERSYEEAAHLMNCAVGTVRSRLHRARILLAARLKPRPALSQVTAR
jgi:RNA polymerase sigma-70 factor (ECF subfamily)